ncbi:MAG TPA: ABC transporter permease, partial [Pyrinomonadaceae bacterium]
MLKDFTYSLRKLINRPSFTAVIVITLGLSIGANTAIFSVVDAVLLRPLPYSDADRLVKVFEAAPQKQQSRLMVSLGDFNQWKRQARSFEDMAALGYVSFRVAGATPEDVAGSRVSPNFFAFLGVKPALGRTFQSEDANATVPGVTVLTHGYWVSHFGQDPNVIHKTLVLNDKPYTIVGVLPATFHQSFESHPGLSQVWVPVSEHTEDGTRTGPGGYNVIARLKPTVTIDQARAEMLGVSQRLAHAYPNTNTGIGAAVYSLHEEVTNATRQSLFVLFAAVGLVLLIACANIVNLLLARSVERAKEVAVRLAIGARRLLVVRQLLIESLMLSVSGGFFGWFVATWILRALVPLIPPNLPRADEIAVDYRSLIFTLAISIGATLMFGLSPALQTARVNLTDALKYSSRTATDNLRSRRFRQSLIVLQLALTTVLLIGAGLLTRSLVTFYRVDPGFDTNDLVSMRLRLPRTGGEDPERWNVFWSSLLDSARQIPGTTGAALANPLPLGESTYMMNVGLPAASEHVVVGYSTVSANYFQTLGIRLLYG